MSRAHLSRADIATIIEDYLARKLGINRPELIDYSLNIHATVLAKLTAQKNTLGYNFDFVAETVKGLGNAESVKALDTTSQLILATTYRPKGKDEEKPEDTVIEEMIENEE